MLKRLSKVMICGALLLVYSVFAEDIVTQIPVQMNSMQIQKQGNPTGLSDDNLLYNGVTYVPLRKTAQEFGYQVNWDAQNPQSADMTPSAPQQNMPLPVSIYRLIANAEEYNGYKIQIEGFCHIFWEYGCSLSTSKEYGESIKLDFAFKDMEEMSHYYKYDKERVLVEGQFSCSEDMTGSKQTFVLRHITRIERLPTTEELDREYQKQAVEQYGEGAFWDWRTSTFVQPKEEAYYGEKYGANWKKIFGLEEWNET